MNETRDTRKRLKTNITPAQLLELGKLPPQAVDLEEAVLGALMLDDSCRDTILPKMGADMFYKQGHQVIAEAIFCLYAESKKIDILTVTQQLKKTGTLEIAGGAFYVTQLTNRVASAANIEEHMLIVTEKYIARELIRINTEALQLSYEENTDIFAMISKLEADVNGVNEIIVRHKQAQTFQTQVDSAVEEIKNVNELAKTGQIIGIPTGFAELDMLTGGWQNGDVIILASRPSMGKTALALHFAESAAKRGFKPCIFSLEMSDVKLAKRIVMGASGIEANRFKGKLNELDLSNIHTSADKLKTLPIYINDYHSADVNYMKSIMRLRKKKGQCDIGIIDYLGLIEAIRDKNDNREQVVSKISRSLKKAAKEIGIPIILLVQLSRAVEQRGGIKKPGLMDLRESGAIEQDADIVMFPWRPSYYGITGDLNEDLSGYGELIVAKHRNGTLDNIKFKHNPSLTAFYDYSYREIPDTTF